MAGAGAPLSSRPFPHVALLAVVHKSAPRTFGTGFLKVFNRFMHVKPLGDHAMALEFHPVHVDISVFPGDLEFIDCGSVQAVTMMPTIQPGRIWLAAFTVGTCF